ncbi:hypothetical protein M758_4G244100 [Ceratodon purpureus]|nr:hypothetical protein M758_4G244100 [Ceratodon purpureus]
MSSCSFSNLSEFNDTAFGWATDQCFLRPRKQRNVLFDLFLTRFGKTSRRAARAVRDFVTCSSPQSNGFSTEDVTTTSQRSPTDVQDSQDETPSTTSNLQTLRDKPGRDDWSNRNGTTSPTRRFSRKLDFNDRERHPHWKNTHDQGVTNGESNLWTHAAEGTSTSNCGQKLPSNFFELPTRQRLRAVKQFLAGFVYKPNSEASLQANKQRPLCRLMATARRIVYKPEPIKSVEAVFLALYLTAGLLSVDRIPVGFETKFAGGVTQHIVVVVQHNDKYGAFGISPNPDLMTKDLQFDSMSSIIENYVKAYEASGHTVLKIRIGLRVEHDVMSSHFICWRHLCLSPGSKSWAECVVDIENHVLRMRHLWDLWMLTGKGHDPHKVGMAKKLEPSNFTPRGKAMEKPGVAAEVKKDVKSGSQVQPTQAMTTQQLWDVESTGSNTEECEHCEQLKRAMPPVDTKRASVTTVKRVKRSGHQDIRFIPKNKIPGQRFTHDSHDPDRQWEAESLGSNTGDSPLKPSIRCKAKQVLKNLVSSSVMSTTPPRRSTNRRGSKDISRNVDTKLRDVSGRKNLGSLYNSSSGRRKSKAG